MNLSDLKIGEKAKVVKVNGRDKERQHLLDMGLIPNTTISIIKRAPMGDPIVVEIHDYNLALRNTFAEIIDVEKINNNEINQEDKFDLCKDYEAINIKYDSKFSKGEKFYNLTKMHNCDLCYRNCKNNPNIFNSKRLSSAHLQNSIKDELINETEHPGFGESGRFHNRNNENPLPDDKIITFALVGNQNSGKTTLFNAMTGSNQHVGNFPGVTIDKKDGCIKGHKNTKITDLPGIYSLSPYSKEEIVSREYILNDDVDCIINIIDATNIERNLYLTLQLLQLEHPMVIALNMMDELSENGSSILINKLEYSLGVPIVPISAIKNEGINELIDHAMHVAKYQELPLVKDFCIADESGGSVHRTLHSIMHIIEDHCSQKTNSNILFDNANTTSIDHRTLKKIEKFNKEKSNISNVEDNFKNNLQKCHNHLVPVRFAAEKIAENDNLIFEVLELNKNDKKAIEHILKHMEEECELDRSALIADMRYSYIMRICKMCVIKGKPSVQRKRSENIDKLLTGKWTGIPSFIVIMALIFWLTFNVIGSTLQNLIESGLNALSTFCMNAMINAGFNDVVRSLVTDGIFAGVGSIIGFLPIIVVMFFFLSILEDSGYMARVAFVMDKALRKIGLSGRSIVPMLIGFGCSVPAIMSTRTLPSERDRKHTIFLIPYMSCSAKLPIYAFITNIFFPYNAAFIMFCLYFGGILIGIVVALLIKGKTKPVPFIMELPNYRIPSAKNVGHLLWDKCKDFLQRAFSVILIATIIIWFLRSFDFSFNYAVEANNSILANIAGLILPVFNPIGLGDWRLVTSLISGLLMKESVVATMGVLFAGSQEILTTFSPVIALSFLTFCLLYTPCIAAISAAKRELGWRYTFILIVLQCVVAWFAAFIVYNLGMFI